MAVANRSNTNVTYATRTNTVLTAPAGIQDGDWLFIYFVAGATGTPPTPTPPAGFSIVPGFPITVGPDGTSFNVASYAWAKRANGEGGNYQVTHSSTTSQGYIVALSGADGGSPFVPSPTIASQAPATGAATSTATGLSTPRDGSLVMFVEHDWGETANNLTGPAGTTPTFVKQVGPSSTSGIIYVADGVLATASATGNKSITNNNVSASTDGWFAALVSVQPPAATVATAAAPVLPPFGPATAVNLVLR